MPAPERPRRITEDRKTMSNRNKRNRRANQPRLDHSHAPWRRNDRPVAPDAVLTQKELQEAVAEMLG